MDYKSLGLNIRKIRTSKGFTQEALAEKCSLSNSYIGTIERAEKIPSIETITKIASELEISLDYLLSESLKTTPGIRVDEIITAFKGFNDTQIDMLLKIVYDIRNYLIK